MKRESATVMPIPAPSERYVHRKSRETFTLRIVPNDVYGRTHKLRNAENYWEGTKEEFERDFERA
jgi:hypothetical protein